MAKFVVAHTDGRWFPPGPEEETVLGRIDAELIAAECATEEQVIELASGADAILNSRARITARVLHSLPRCRVISRYGIGVDNIDVPVATTCGIVVANVPDFCIDEVSSHVVALLLTCARRMFPLVSIARGGNWSADVYPRIARVAGQTFGAVGFGRIGRAAARKVKALGMKVLVYDPYVDETVLRRFGAERAPLDEFLTRSDFVSLHVPLSPETRHLFGESVLRKMKSSAFLINCARGAVVNEPALVKALREGWISGAGLDVLEKEPAELDNPLLAMPNVIVTPHCGAYSEESFRDLRRRAAEAIARVLTGKWPRSVVNPQVRDGAANQRARMQKT